jgi:hypothetical protein
MRDKIALLEHRRDGIRQWLKDEAPHCASEQKHLEAASTERTYWHHGYQAALNDAIALLSPSKRKIRQRGHSQLVPFGRPGWTRVRGGLIS